MACPAAGGRERAAELLGRVDEWGNTALHMAVMGGDVDIIKLLAGTGAAPHAVNDGG